MQIYYILSAKAIISDLFLSNIGQKRRILLPTLPNDGKSVCFLLSLLYFCRQKTKKQMNEKRTLRRRLAVDTLLSTSGSVAAILLMRGVSDPVPGFVVLLAWWTGCAALLSLTGLLLTGNSQVVMRYASLRGYSRLGRALLIKEAGMIILVLAGLLKLPSTTLAVVALLADLLFSAIALFAPRILVRSVRREEREIHATTGRRIALVAGIGLESINLADEAEASGRFTVLGYLSNNPADAGKVIGNRIVYAAATAEDIDALQWRLGGVDCILFPKGGDRDRPGETASGKASDDTNIPNTDAMIYGNEAGRNVVPGKTVNVQTYKVVAQKVDAVSGDALEGALFGLYEDQACTTEIARATSVANTGIADFKVKLPAGTYYVKEIEAPRGYNLNSEVKDVTLSASKTSVTVVIEDTQAKLPSTGGNGTLMFTIIGGSLVLLAAALFVIVMKKRSSAK